MTTLKVESVPLTSLTPDPDNARLHGDDNLEAITNSLKRFGQVKPIVVTAGGKVLAGNGTLQAATRLGWKDIQVVRTPADWSDTEAMAYALADNRTAELADWNKDVLAAQLVDLSDNGWNLNELGFASIPLQDIDEKETSAERNERNGTIQCPKCGHTWLRNLKVAAK